MIHKMKGCLSLLLTIIAENHLHQSPPVSLFQHKFSVSDAYGSKVLQQLLMLARHK